MDFSILIDIIAVSMILFIPGILFPNLLKVGSSPTEIGVGRVAGSSIGPEAADRVKVKVDCMRHLRYHFSGGDFRLRNRRDLVQYQPSKS
jgi:hypothetical protein